MDYERIIMKPHSVQFSCSLQASLSFIISQSLLKLVFIESVMSSNHLILCWPLLLLPSIFSQHQGLFRWVSSSHQVAKVLEFQPQYQSFQWTFETDFLQDWLVWSPYSPVDSQESLPHQNSKASILRCTAFFMVEPLQLYIITNHCTGTKLKTEKGEEVYLGSGGLSVVSERPTWHHI